MGTHISITKLISCPASLHRTLQGLLCGQAQNKSMCGIDHESKILLDHPYDTNSLTPNAPY
jgi:hypothetical protein